MVEVVIKSLTQDIGVAQALREYSLGNMFEYIVKAMVEDGVSLENARELTLRSYLRELEGKRVR